ncbi:MAG: GIY-YIG nuclease family protein [Candidatus Lokiarchaeota archaeon]|nr:GIY-YIG nuclease family protein [Candidatus Lokiarchaeota archaeon]
MYYVYIIETEDETYYTGITNNLLRRMKEHTSGSGRGAAYLRMHKPKYLVYLAECETRSEAQKLEYKIKKDQKLKMSLIGPRRDLREVIETEESYL